MKQYYDAVVVGAGPAGAAAAYTMARGGMTVALFERGEFPGAKNMFGGTIYREPMEKLIPAFWHEAPVERPIVEEQMWFLDQDSAVKAGFAGLRFGQEPYNKFSVLRPKFDKWFADKAVQAGADLFTSALVTEVVRKNKRGPVIGVRLQSGDVVYGDIVILAEGVLAFLTKQAGLRSAVPAHAYTLYVKEVLELPAGVIEERFHLEKGMGAIIGFVGYPTAGIIGKSGIWTNKDSVSIVVGGYLDQMVSRNLSPYLLLQRLKGHPLVKPLIAGAKPVEYLAHMIPKGGLLYIPNLYDDGIMVAGDAAVMVSGRRGSDLAMLSGQMAGETALQAKAKGSASRSILAAYNRKLNETFFMKVIKANKGDLKYYETHSDADYLLTSVLNELAYEFFTVDMKTGAEKNARMRSIVNAKQLPLKTICDIYHGVMHWGVF